jgi:pSer/pThr/pTyr-binding forkhead associated (FHA) protein
MMSGSGGQSASLQLVAGKDKGRAFELSGDRVAIGRNDNNDIILPSESVSRYHASLERTSEGHFFIRDNQSKNGVVINGTPVKEAVLSTGDLIQIGTFVFRFTGSVDAQEEGAFGEPVEEVQDPAYPQPLANLGKPVKMPSRRPLIYGMLGLALVGVYYVSQSPGDKTKEGEQTAPPAVDAPPTPPPVTGANTTPGEVPKLAPPVPGSKIPGMEDPTISAVEQKLGTVDLGNNAIRESEQYFRKGQREYLSKNYLRAIEDFRAAISLYRGHELADYYLRLSIYQVENEAKKNFGYGRKYFESMQYSRALFHFGQVIELMEHKPEDPMNAESLRYIDLCKKRLQAAEQFP